MLRCSCYTYVVKWSRLLLCIIWRIDGVHGSAPGRRAPRGCFAGADSQPITHQALRCQLARLRDIVECTRGLLATGQFNEILTHNFLPNGFQSLAHTYTLSFNSQKFYNRPADILQNLQYKSIDTLSQMTILLRIVLIMFFFL